jgi:hypothetical protein
MVAILLCLPALGFSANVHEALARLRSGTHWKDIQNEETFLQCMEQSAVDEEGAELYEAIGKYCPVATDHKDCNSLPAEC